MYVLLVKTVIIFNYLECEDNKKYTVLKKRYRGSYGEQLNK